ncbi:MAG: MFS transporter [Solirubrobacterales bacterium]|nr:MFS transporter [Solirubrobacterales bacterium]
MTNLSQPSSPPTASRSDRDARRRERSVLAIVCAGVVLASLDLFIVNVALPQIGRDLGAGRLAGLSWILNAYAIVYAAFLVVFGRLADRYPRERGFALGVAVFVAASAACAAASSVPMLVAFRVVQAAGAALLTPTSLGLVLATTAPERRHAAVRAWTAVGGVAAALGPVVGGLLVAASWRWVFLVNVPIGLGALAVGSRRLPRVAGHAGPAPDAVGAALITAGVGLLTLGLVQGGSWGWVTPRTLGALALSGLALALFTARVLSHRNPLIDRALFRVRPFTGASVVALLFSVAFGAMLLSRVLWLQGVWHWSPLLTGLAIAPGPVMVPLFSFGVAGRMIVRFGPGRVIAVGSAIFAAGAVWWALAAGLTPDYAGEMLPGMLLTGIGVGLTLPTTMASGASSLPAHAFATGSAVVNMLRQVGLAIGVAVLIAVLGSPGSGSAIVLAYRRANLVTAAIAGLAGAAGLVLLPAVRRRRALAPEAAEPAVAMLGATPAGGEPG